MGCQNEGVVKTERDEMRIIILGAGLSGIVLKEHIPASVILEKTDMAGGLCSSHREKGFTCDAAGHFLHIPKNHEAVVSDFVHCKLEKHIKRTGIYMAGKYIDYPFQTHFHSLPEQYVNKCIEGFRKRKTDIEPENFRDWVMKYYGGGIGELFMFPYNRKVWQCEPEHMGFEWTGNFIPELNENDILKGSSSVKAYNSVFYYPEEPGFDNIMNGHEPEALFNKTITGIDIQAKKVITADGEYKYDKLISTIPLPELCTLCGIDNTGLEYSSCMNINLGVRGNAPHQYHWVYYPEKALPFYRAGILSNINSLCAPEGHYTLSVEIGYKGEYSKKDIADSLIKAGLIKSRGDIVSRKDFNIRYAYVTFNDVYKDRRSEILDELESYDILCTGRYGRWHYSFAAGDIADAVSTAKRVKWN